METAATICTIDPISAATGAAELFRFLGCGLLSLLGLPIFDNAPMVHIIA